MKQRRINVLVFGASGLVGAEVLRACLLHPEVARVVSIGRSPLALHIAKLQEICRPDLGDLAPLTSQLLDPTHR